MNNNLEENLKKINLKSLSNHDKDVLWHKLAVAKFQSDRNQNSILAINIFNYINMKKTIIISAVALLIVLGGGGVVAASNSSMPGDLLYGVEKAVEKIQLNLASGEKKIDLKLKFAEERISEIKKVSEEKGFAVLVADLSQSTALEIEADVFTNETIVKIEANDKKYGYISELKTKDALVKEIAEKYSLTEVKVLEIINFEAEDRDSGAEDRGFLNKLNGAHFSEKENDDVGDSLSELEEILDEDISDDKKVQIESALQELLVLLGDDADLEIKRNGNKIEIKSENGDVEVKVKIENDNEGKKDDDNKKEDSEDNKGDDEKNDDSPKVENSISNTNNDVKEDESEVFCRGEWRDVEDCNDEEESSNEDESDDSSDSSGSSDNSNDDNEEEDDSDEDNSGSGQNSNDEEEDDNSGSGSNN